MQNHSHRESATDRCLSSRRSMAKRNSFLLISAGDSGKQSRKPQAPGLNGDSTQALGPWAKWLQLRVQLRDVCSAVRLRLSANEPDTRWPSSPHRRPHYDCRPIPGSPAVLLTSQPRDSGSRSPWQSSEHKVLNTPNFTKGREQLKARQDVCT